MHSRQCVAARDDLGFGGRHLREPATHHFGRGKLLGEADVGGVVPGLALEEAAVELG